MQIKQTKHGYIAWCIDQAKALESVDFSVEPWQAKHAVTGQSCGRYTTWFVQPQTTSQQWVLRHYWRGGLAAKLSKDGYLYTSLNNTRAVAELALLETLYQQGFAVPKPIAAQVQRFGIWYRADIIIERIAGAKDLVAYLTQHTMTNEQWQSLGQTIAKFHQHGVYHADLNAKNILISADTFYLIDFDRGVIKTPAKSWQQANLARLLRSFNKEQTKAPVLQFTQDNWQALLTGYQQFIR
ncbi:3-deoxy-D-manno-octulosonic acid kinase [Shewanella intestini]|uniref:3-deoxy-D-manno-octulosonic acid kinase n=1 Tax=Shewanella intestini TaxID=2017544 RepID=A0ABS5I3M6_9GAMM|nr:MULTISPECIES: 3-deoxy-D-manno-octulosonic acid kinase [Shewanella]MBR9728627.1 3-deoxy-D-manno-octulosonic acid kinase [Shewanella intestini]MRG37317.1 3-deoxy-D-manno-octulosonic acid kinase [Shewanella sp. XMDDZSB0408]